MAPEQPSLQWSSPSPCIGTGVGWIRGSGEAWPCGAQASPAVLCCSLFCILAVDSEAFLYLPLDQGGASHRKCTELTFLPPLTLLPAVLEPAETCRSLSKHSALACFKVTSKKKVFLLHQKLLKIRYYNEQFRVVLVKLN